MITKRIKTVFFAFLFMTVFFSLCASASNIDEYYNDQLEASGAKELSEYLDEDTRDYLEKLGCEELDFERLLDVSPKAVFELIFEMFRNGINAPLKGFLTAAGTVILVGVCSGFFPDDEKSRIVPNIICGSILVTGIFASSFESVKAASAAIEACSAFEKALIPVLAAIVTACGNPALALTFKGAAFAAAEFVSYFGKNFALPLVGISGALGLTGAMLPTLRLSAVSEMIRKTMSTALASASGLFVGFLSLKSILSSSADGMIKKGVRLAANTFIPIIGGAIGEAYSSVLGTLSLLRNTVGFYAVTAFFVICIPVVLNLALWAVSMRAACAVSDLLDCRICSEILRNIAFIFSMVNTLLLLCMVVFIISTGIVVAVKTGE